MHRCASWLAALALVVACSKQNAPVPSGGEPESDDEKSPAVTRPSVVFLGDSLTAGRGLSEDQAVPALIQAKLDAAGLDYRVVNAGRSGDTTAGGLARLDWYLRDNVDARLLVIGLGSNDAMRGIGLDAIETNLRGIVRHIQKVRPATKILLWELQTFPNMGPEYGQAYNDLFKRVATEEKVTLVPFPLAGVAGKPELNTNDGIHPNAEGSRIVADNIWKTLSPLL
jgi:acyl-CoA thioesterase-1